MCFMQLPAYYCKCFTSFLDCLCKFSMVLGYFKYIKTITLPIYYYKRFAAFKLLASFLDCFKYIMYIYSSFKEMSTLFMIILHSYSFIPGLLCYKGFSGLLHCVQCINDHLFLGLLFKISGCLILFFAYTLFHFM